jgi:hypothetical protein
VSQKRSNRKAIKAVPDLNHDHKTKIHTSNNTKEDRFPSIIACKDKGVGSNGTQSGAMPSIRYPESHEGLDYFSSSFRRTFPTGTLTLLYKLLSLLFCFSFINCELI